MRKRRKGKYPRYENVEIIDLVLDGKAVAKIKSAEQSDELLTIFVTKVVPGDIVDVQINKKKRNYREGYPVKFHKFSDDRIEPVCTHFGVCGGCTRQSLSYDKQLFYKQKQIEDTLTRIGKVELPEIEQILPSPETEYYRNKLEYTFSNYRWLTDEDISSDNQPVDNRGLGFHIPGRFDKVLDIEECLLQTEPSNKIRLEIKDFAVKNDYDFFDLKKQEGFLRNLIIRTSTTGDLMVILSFFKENKEKREAILNMLSEKFPEINSLMYVINGKRNDTITDLKIENYKGNSFIFEQMENLKFKIGPKSFYQTNSKQAYNLYKKIREYAELTGNEVVYDLYTGTGTIANFVALESKQVIGIEYVPEAIEDAKVNSGINDISNTKFFAGDMKDVLTDEFIQTHGKPDIIILDPPRAGIHKDVVKTILNAEPEKIIYVSCNPATQARDIQLLCEKYQFTNVQPVDMFPHTYHTENIVVAKKIHQIKN